MPRYRVTLTYEDGDERTVHIEADDPDDAEAKVRAMAKRQLNDSSWGGDRSKGMPKVSGAKEDEHG